MEPQPPETEMTPKLNLFVRAICIFIGADDYAEPVRVCYTHSRDSVGHVSNVNFTRKKIFKKIPSIYCINIFFQAKSTVADHLVRCNHTKSFYQLDSGKA